MKRITEAKMVIPDEDVVVTKPFMSPEWGIYALCYMQVCAHSEVPPEQVERRANELNPVGTSGQWRIASEYPNGQVMKDNPVPCVDADGTKTGRLHYLLSC